MLNAPRVSKSDDAMFLGHFAMGVATKPLAPKLPVWALLLAPQLMDLLFLPLVALGVEGYEPGAYGHDVLDASYTHSLVGALLIAFAAFLAARAAWNTSSALILAALSFSHWVIDLFVHHQDMPLLPGNLAGFPMLGFGLWDFEYAVFGLEVLMAATGVAVYFRWAYRERPSSRWFLGPMSVALIFSLMIIADIPRLPPL
jgi:hypothetical protein